MEAFAHQYTNARKLMQMLFEVCFVLQMCTDAAPTRSRSVPRDLPEPLRTLLGRSGEDLARPKSALGVTLARLWAVPGAPQSVPGASWDTWEGPRSTYLNFRSIFARSSIELAAIGVRFCASAAYLILTTGPRDTTQNASLCTSSFDHCLVASACLARLPMLCCGHHHHHWQA